ncbi:hypothetical protein [Nannocystis bainbridge]|uniref:Uncharacterized protein n=1 Tax=Nannocystis bainbridge TaxID=2995303 RepID=A0ABT5EAD4_9BACT|nr:hypothetical protein [Nannocystis bainbridge]MDC0722817.1 hypothetical protein [Nannocystis bainbridge]
MMLSVACFTGCDANEGFEAEDALLQLDDAELELLAEAQEAQSDDEVRESAFETELDVVSGSSLALSQTCEQWTPPFGLCQTVFITCKDPEATPGPCATLTQCYKCRDDWP